MAAKNSTDQRDPTPFKVHLMTRAGRVMRVRSGPVRAFSTKDEAVRFAGGQLGGDHMRSTINTGKFGPPRKGPFAVRWNVASAVVLAWIVTLPAAALFGAPGRSFPPPIRKGQRLGCPFERESMALDQVMRLAAPRLNGRPSFWERPSHALPDRE